MNRKKIEFFKHNLEKIDITSCQKVLNSIFLTSGEVTKQFEDKLRKLVGSKYAVGVTSCTDALFLSLKYFGIKKGDEVITSPLSFVSTANVIEHCGAKPVFVDVELDTGNIDANLLEKHINKNTKAIIPVHLYGQMCDMSKIRKIAKKHKISVVEDSAHCLEGSRNGFKPGMLSDMACFSFYTTKTLTCGEGGAIACNNKDIYEWLIRARLHGINKSAADRYTKLYQHYDMEFLGYKCNLTNISSSLLINQIERVIKYKRQRLFLAKLYDAGFSNNPNIKKPLTLAGVSHSRYIYTILVNPKKRDEYLHKIQESNIGVAVNFRPIHLMSYYKNKYKFKPGDFVNAETIGNSTITLPLYPKLKLTEIRRVIKSVNEIVIE